MVITAPLSPAHTPPVVPAHTPPVGTRDNNAFLRDLAHELRSPLCSFSLALADLTDHDTPLDLPDHALLLDALRRSAAHLHAIVEGLGDRADGAPAFAVHPTPTALAPLLRDAAAIVAPLLRPAAQRVALDLPPDPLTVLADAPRLRQVLVNLLHNASKYGPSGETITVRAHVEMVAALVTIAVSDCGPALPPQQHARLFERAVRGHPTASPGDGRGLAISKAIVAAHGGSIGVRSAPGRGNTFWFTLPLG